VHHGVERTGPFKGDVVATRPVALQAPDVGKEARVGAAAVEGRDGMPRCQGRFDDVPAGEGRPSEDEQLHPGHAMVRPPLTDSVWPVMNPASSDTMKATAPAMSSGTPMRRIGMPFLRASI